MASLCVPKVEHSERMRNQVTKLLFPAVDILLDFQRIKHYTF